MVCDVCGKEIERGKRFTGERYKQNRFCSESCYKEFIEIKDKQKRVSKAREELPGLRKLTDYIQAIYYTEPNWLEIVRQIKQMTKQYDLTCDEIRATIKYAVQYEGVDIKEEYGLYQFIPKYVEPMRAFTRAIKDNMNVCITEDETIVVKAVKGSNKVNKKNMEF